jgi:hypothetical protein
VKEREREREDKEYTVGVDMIRLRANGKVQGEWSFRRCGRLCLTHRKQ